VVKDEVWLQFHTTLDHPISRKRRTNYNHYGHQGKVWRDFQATNIQSKLCIVLLGMFADSS